MAVAHPPTREVVLSDGTRFTLRPWTMAQRHDLRPKLAALLETMSQLDGGLSGAASLGMGQIFLLVEDEIAELCLASSPPDIQERWETLYLEDLPVIAQAIWELNVMRSDGGGLLGKLAAGLGQIMAHALEAHAREAKVGDVDGASPSPSPTDPNRTESRPSASPS